MSHKHDRKLLAEFWAHPVPGNIAYKDAVSLLSHLGATIEEHAKSKVGVHLNGHTMFLHHAEHSLSRDDVQSIRKFLETCGVTPESAG